MLNSTCLFNFMTFFISHTSYPSFSGPRLNSHIPLYSPFFLNLSLLLLHLPKMYPLSLMEWLKIWVQNVSCIQILKWLLYFLIESMLISPSRFDTNIHGYTSKQKFHKTICIFPMCDGLWYLVFYLMFKKYLVFPLSWFPNSLTNLNVKSKNTTLSNLT